MRTGGQNFALHQKNDLIVVFDRSDLLSDRQQCDSGVITVYILEDLAFSIGVDTCREVIEEQNFRIESKGPGQHDALLLTAG